MRERIIIGLLSLLFPVGISGQNALDTDIPLAPLQNRRPADYKLVNRLCGG
jgi:hypothetical protein